LNVSPLTTNSLSHEKFQGIIQDIWKTLIAVAEPFLAANNGKHDCLPRNICFVMRPALSCSAVLSHSLLTMFKGALPFFVIWRMLKRLELLCWMLGCFGTTLFIMHRLSTTLMLAALPIKTVWRLLSWLSATHVLNG
jgi:hypothetical protein